MEQILTEVMRILPFMLIAVLFTTIAWGEELGRVNKEWADLCSKINDQWYERCKALEDRLKEVENDENLT